MSTDIDMFVYILPLACEGRTLCEATLHHLIYSLNDHHHCARYSYRQLLNFLALCYALVVIHMLSYVVIDGNVQERCHFYVQNSGYISNYNTCTCMNAARTL
jgi:hypothetical protein